MTVGIEMGSATSGEAARIDLEELLSTRLLVQGNSGSGKSHLLRRLLEQSAPWVQQVVIDPEGDFVTLADRHGHMVIDAADHSEAALHRNADLVRRHRVSVVLNLESVEVDDQLRRAGAFLNGLFEADRDAWSPVMVVVDEAQLFAPAAASETSDEARRIALGAMTNLMCRGRKRGLAGVIATQRLAKLAKNVAAEASNFMMGRTFLDIDMARAGDLLGMDRRQAEMFRDLPRGTFVALGPAMSRRPLPVRIGSVETATRSAGPRMMPLPDQAAMEQARELILNAPEPETALPPRQRRAPRAPAPDILQQLAQYRPPAMGRTRPAETVRAAECAEAVAERDRRLALRSCGRSCPTRRRPSAPPRCCTRTSLSVAASRKSPGTPLELPAFRRMLATALAGIDESTLMQGS